MYGAIVGDIIGSRFEFDRGEKSKTFELFTDRNCFTDDTVMTVAVADALLQAGRSAGTDEIHRQVIRCMKYWGLKYPDAGYGGSFFRWLVSQRRSEPYGSYGNGSAMRVSAAGWLYDSIERTRAVARATAEVTHNHPEGIRGAECTAAVIYLARTGASKDEIRDYTIREFGYHLNESLEQLRLHQEQVVSCQDTLPKALTCFLLGTDYEDVVRNAIYLGGDTDTVGAISGSMAEAFFGIPEPIRKEGCSFLTGEILQVLRRFDKELGRQ